MRTLVLSTFIVVLVSVASATVSAQAVRRVTFSKGATSTVLSGTLNSYKGSARYKIRVRRGQTLTTASIGDSHPVTITIKEPSGSFSDEDMDLSCHSRHTVNPTTAGDYTIIVTECQKADPWRGKFKVRVNVN